LAFSQVNLLTKFSKKPLNKCPAKVTNRRQIGKEAKDSLAIRLRRKKIPGTSKIRPKFSITKTTTILLTAIITKALKVRSFTTKTTKTTILKSSPKKRKSNKSTDHKWKNLSFLITKFTKTSKNLNLSSPLLLLLSRSNNTKKYY
jgi:hypothetical protein